MNAFLLLSCLAASGASVATGGVADPPVSLELTREAVAKYVTTRQLISQEKQEWQLGREMLGQRVTLMEKEIAALREKITEAEANVSDADKKRVELIAQRDALRAATAGLTDQIATLEAGVQRLLRQTPAWVQDKLRPLSQSLPAEPAKTQLSLSARFQNVIGLLNELTKLAGAIHVATELRSLTGGTTVEVKTLYLGLGAGYYVTSAGDAAGIGRPGADGWQWQPANDLAPRIAEAIAIFQNEKMAGFVLLPVEIQ